MGSKVTRLGDVNSAGGATLAGSSKVHVNGRKMCWAPGIPVSGHGKGIHAGPSTSGGSPKVHVEGKPVSRVGDPDTCGHVRQTGARNVDVY